jgi:hypothetical protein
MGWSFTTHHDLTIITESMWQTVKVTIAAAIPLSSPPLHYRVSLVVLVLKAPFVCLGQAVADGTMCVQEGVAGVELDNTTALRSSACKPGGGVFA